eukprot:2839814-Rhodomonas_salina.1
MSVPDIAYYRRRQIPPYQTAVPDIAYQKDATISYVSTGLRLIDATGRRVPERCHNTLRRYRTSQTRRIPPYAKVVPDIAYLSAVLADFL